MSRWKHLSSEQKVHYSSSSVVQNALSMQPGSSTVTCASDFTSSRLGAVPCQTPIKTLFDGGSSVCRSASCGFHGEPSDHLLLGEYGVMPVQQQMSIFEAIPSTISCSPSRTPPTFDLLKPGMREVPAWLKSLRLHKYTAMFAELSYEQMMALDEAELEKRNVTKGARKKILQSIQKLRNRAADLRALHEQLSLAHPERCLRCAISSLRQMIATPMIPYTPVAGESSDSIDGLASLSCISEQNVPGLIFNLLGEVQRAVFVSGRQPMDIEYEYLLMLFTIFDKLCNNEAFTPMQRQRVHQWKRLARKAIRPADVRRRRVSFPHSGKCENCHYKMRKSMVYRENERLNVKPSAASLDKVLNHYAQQYQLANPIYNNNFSHSTRDWSSLVRTSPSTPSPMVLQQHGRQNFLNCGQWNSIFTSDGGNVLRARSRQMAPLSAQVLTQSLPQYRSQRHVQTSESVDTMPLLYHSSQSYESSSRWPRAIYENNEFLAEKYVDRGKFQSYNSFGPSTNLWDLLSSPCSGVERSGGDSTSGYCSSTSERSSGAGSPRASGTGQTLYDRVCRDLAVLPLSI
ncbi:hypothetical protein KIN20_003165 [Parelaphostrongylus tenuis]|uniref:SAM domain-containing protein n=1 Tax=Parelaphostrongylus tenuis TaxID=148309 RepID=A0AAD5QDI4_PARTN|nr:hypothetical protein KIN20_003165 [Parelaphostrongylus tenuis]